MPATSIQSPFPIFTDIDGQPLEQGQVWLGTAGNNPISSPITAYWDAGLTQVVTQPVTTRGGYPMNGTAVGRLYVNADFSILVRNRRGYDVLSALSATERYDSSLVTFVQAGLGAVTRTAQAKMRDVVSVKDFGAVGNGVADDTVAIQTAITSAIASDKALYIPSGVYRITSQLSISMSGTTRGLVVRGETGNDILGNTGSLIDFSSISGADAVAVTAGNAQAFTVFESVSFLGSGTVNHGFHYTNASYAQFTNCTFCNFSKTGYAAVRFTGSAGGFVGVSFFNKCSFQSNYYGVWVVGDNCNVFGFDKTTMLDHTGVAIYFGAPLTLQQNRVVNITSCTLEGNVRDVLCYSAIHGLTITGNYIENNNNAHTGPRIELVNDGTNADSSALTISGNQFQKSIVSAGQSIIALNSVVKGYIKDNFSALGNDSGKFFLYGLNCKGIEFDVPHSPPGQTPAYPVVISRTGAGASKTFTYSATSDDRVPITTLRILGSSEAYPGASTTTTNSAVYSRYGDIVTISFDITLTTKNGASTGYCNIGGLPFSNGAADARFDFSFTSGVARTGPTYHGIIPSGANYIQLTDSDLTQVDLPAFVSAGARLKATFSYLTS